MKQLLLALALAIPLAIPMAVRAQVPVRATADHESLLATDDATTRANKRLVYDFWREVLEAHRLELADKYLTEDYIQHNPRVPTGRGGFVAYFSKFAKPKPVEPRVKAPLVHIVAEGNLVVLSFVRELPEPQDASQKYTTTWFDMFRIENGKIAEHWDNATK